MKKVNSRSWMTAATVGSALVISLGLAGCGHKAAPPPPVPAPAPKAAPAPTVTLSADPTSIESGSSSTLTWSSTNATTVELNGNSVDVNGSQTVSPTESTDYQIVATGADGQTANDSVRVSVTQPPPPPPPPPPPATQAAPSFRDSVHDAYFDFDKSDIRPDAQQALDADATYLKSNPNIDVEVVGHCDARGSAEYNLALGHRRADAVKNYLVSQGVDASRITTSSVGKEDPFCTETTSECYQQNRRGHFVRGQ
jgi:peptidoglycan-associated lipoprotein